MIKKIKFLILILPILYISQTKEEIEIYSNVISSNYSKSKKSITLQKQTHNFTQERINKLKYKNLKVNFKTLTIETFHSFINKNKSESTITNKFDKNLKVILIDKSEIHEIVKPPSGWNKFYKNYKNSIGILEFSKIGFDKNGTQAFLYYSKTSGFLNGSGHYAIFQKKNGKWKLVTTSMAWIS